MQENSFNPSFEELSISKESGTLSPNLEVATQPEFRKFEYLGMIKSILDQLEYLQSAEVSNLKNQITEWVASRSTASLEESAELEIFNQKLEEYHLAVEESFQTFLPTDSIAKSLLTIELFLDIDWRDEAFLEMVNVGDLAVNLGQSEDFIKELDELFEFST